MTVAPTSLFIRGGELEDLAWQALPPEPGMERAARTIDRIGVLTGFQSRGFVVIEEPCLF